MIHTAHITKDHARCSCGLMPAIKRPATETVGDFTLRTFEIHREHAATDGRPPVLFDWRMPEVERVEGGLFA